MAFYYLSILATPVLFGVLADLGGTGIFPLFLLGTYLLMTAFAILLKVGDARSRNER